MNKINWCWFISTFLIELVSTISLGFFGMRKEHPVNDICDSEGVESLTYCFVFTFTGLELVAP